ncbi:MAG: helix-turn-helix domain-containing protein [Oligosphaeraceae bacterium]|nr:helix-turn-helix domain-containing protein [Oligosphaeraceae bacterium]
MASTMLPFPELLYFGWGSVPSAKLHQHAFYQLELCRSGALLCQAASGKFLLREGDLWLIPPGIRHQFLDQGEYSYLSLKFNWAAQLPARIKFKDGVTEYYMHVLWDILQQKVRFSPYSPEGKAIIENHLYGLLRHLYDDEQQVPQESFFIMQLREEICKHGYEVNVEQLAQYCQCTRAQLKYRFAKECRGSGKIKQFINQVLLDLALKHLQYSPLKVSKIAAEMHFPSVYAFSRFIKRTTGKTPSQCRHRDEQN